MLRTKRLRPWIPLLLIVAIVSVTFVINFYMLNQNEAPPGADYGNYLIQTDILNGHDLRGYGLRHNPVFFILLDGFQVFLDDFTALKVAAAFVFSIIAVPLFLLAKKFTGRSIIAAISTIILVLFISYTEMISWGGNPNYLGFAFMLMTFYFFIDLIKQPSKKNLVLSGFFLSLAIGTHMLVAVFTFFTLFIFTILHSVFMGERKKKFKNLTFMVVITALFSLPYISYYLSFFRNSSEVTSLRFLDFQLAAGSITDIWGYIPFFAIVAITIAGIFGLSTYVKEDRTNGFLAVSFLAAPLILVLFTAQPVRWIYFLPIPVLLCFGVFFKYVFAEIKGSKRNALVLTILFILTIGVYSTYYSLDHYTHALVDYQFLEDDQIQALNWIKNTTPQSSIFATSGSSKNIGGGGNSYAWWVEGYSKRICMFDGDMEFFSYQYEREEVNKTNRIFDGTYLAEYGNMRVSEGFPSEMENPKIAVYIDKDKFEDLLELNDHQHQLYFSPNNDKFSMLIGSYDSDNKKVSIAEDNSSITVNYFQQDFELTRKIIFNNKSSSVSADIIYEITPINSTLRIFKLNLWAQFETSLSNCHVDQNNNVILSTGTNHDDKTVKISLAYTNGKVKNTQVFYENEIDLRPVVNYQIEPTQENLTVSLNILIDSSSTNDTNIHLISSYDLINDLKIDYILLDKGKSNQFNRFLRDEENYASVYDNDIIRIFRIK